ncbi:prion-inhibition and propagation-domain-containing protein [Podospora didyma]|uniref:Prion-inhibition and propagation-domain-containing protein n=1 Tax=Podospora didyma TaxID=330526 RepID=A0AAE0KDP8_9PEZI|nr:prion-inhibition and propagation-domain-containing protein [Podospora didyma]
MQFWIRNLDIRKTLFLQWGNRVRIFDPEGHDKRLSDPSTQKTVAKTLSAIQLLLNESNDLQHRYGMAPAREDEVARHAAPILSGQLAIRLGAASESCNRRIQQHAQKSVVIKVRWVIHDKDKFNDLVHQLSFFISSLFDLKKILNLLWFRLIGDRKANVAKAHAKTFVWALYPPSPNVQWDDLSEWLRSGEGVYWISRKAGSGKSTLMKYLFHHPRTTEMLAKWSGSRPLTKASFFLWNLGAPEQHSQEGLARALFNATTGSYCFFIDGLDEYSGKLGDGVAFINSLVINCNLKVIVSSRPMDQCAQAFSALPSQKLEDLTRDDISRVVDDTIGAHHYMKTLMSQDCIAVRKLVQDFKKKASGVFLWVILACRSLLEGFAAYDYLAELQQRVNELPPELDDLFRHILNKVAQPHRIQGAKLLRICYQIRLLGISEHIFTIGLAVLEQSQMDLD